jgi:hypothetical protein
MGSGAGSHSQKEARRRRGGSSKRREIGRAHFDGGLDALAAEGMPQALVIESLEAALLAAGLSLGLALLRQRREWRTADPTGRGQLLQEALAATGLGALSGAGLSLVQA